MAESIAMPKTSASAAPCFVPSYWEEAKAELMKRDRIMRKLIPQFGDLCLVGRGEAFTTLARSIVGQQISVKATETKRQKLLLECPKCTPAQIIRSGGGGRAAGGRAGRGAGGGRGRAGRGK